jgi:hypothetical protein
MVIPITVAVASLYAIPPVSSSLPDRRLFFLTYEALPERRCHSYYAGQLIWVNWRSSLRSLICCIVSAHPPSSARWIVPSLFLDATWFKKVMKEDKQQGHWARFDRYYRCLAAQLS